MLEAIVDVAVVGLAVVFAALTIDLGVRWRSNAFVYRIVEANVPTDADGKEREVLTTRLVWYLAGGGIMSLGWLGGTAADRFGRDVVADAMAGLVFAGLLVAGLSFVLSRPFRFPRMMVPRRYRTD